jgi:NAD(P)H-dependent FMN reductase
MRVLAISGSIRANSSNGAILLAAKLCAPSVECEIVLAESLEVLPHFNPDLDGEGAVLPASVTRLRAALASTDGLLISTPEYAHGIPGVLKNALDWLVSGPEMVGRPVALFSGSATEGSFAITALIEVLKTMSSNVVAEAIVSIPGVRTKISPIGEVTDPTTLAAIQDGLRNLRKFGTRK